MYQVSFQGLLDFNDLWKLERTGRIYLDGYSDDMKTDEENLKELLDFTEFNHWSDCFTSIITTLFGMNKDKSVEVVNADWLDLRDFFEKMGSTEYDAYAEDYMYYGERTYDYILDFVNEITKSLIRVKDEYAETKDEFLRKRLIKYKSLTRLFFKESWYKLSALIKLEKVGSPIEEFKFLRSSTYEDIVRNLEDLFYTYHDCCLGKEELVDGRMDYYEKMGM
mgnify:CR=1 FL=1